MSVCVCYDASVCVFVPLGLPASVSVGVCLFCFLVCLCASVFFLSVCVFFFVRMGF